MADPVLGTTLGKMIAAPEGGPGLAVHPVPVQLAPIDHSALVPPFHVHVAVAVALTGPARTPSQTARPTAPIRPATTVGVPIALRSPTRRTDPAPPP
ncbi:MAG: hypothetical protein ACYCZN_10020 [Candidatus Dormibacteria bacterium]